MSGAGDARDVVVRLYTGRGVVPGVVGVVVSPYNDPPVGVVAPWPDTLTKDVAFGVALVAADGAVREWLLPGAVEVFRLQGAVSAESVAVVSFAALLGRPIPDPHPPRSQVVAALEKSQSVVATMIDFAPDAFGTLAAAAPSPAPSLASGVPQRLAAVPVKETIADGATVADGICHWLHWD
ncbi:hypothetical protein ACFY1L_46315 [Streptomyces sp. NPDC001663]|uniref:hypothetical protein n=1 Tax=Streptomyces sp. NPDC001663 TaxID=3364597 RepID=UPI0036BF909F